MENTEEIPGVVGSIIQRSIIPRELSTMLNIITVPYSELSRNVDSLKALTTQMFGIATNDMISQNEYMRSLKALRDPHFWDEIEHFYFKFYGPSFKMFLHDWFHSFRGWAKRYSEFWIEEEPKSTLADDVILCQLSGADIQNVPGVWTPYLFPFPPIPPSYPREMNSEFLSRYEIRPEAMAIAIRVRSTALFSSKRVALAVHGIYEYHIPSGQSPRTTSDTLRNIIKSARNIVVAPLIAGGLGSATLISTGQYLLAIECAAAASGATLFLVATTSLADYIISYVSKRRGRLERQGKEE
jgi:hypothetical protein